MTRTLIAPLIALVTAALLAAAPAFASMERGRAAQARGDLRAAQIEFRNAVRNAPNSAEARAALAGASLDLGDTDTAEKEARAALERGFDRAAGTALLIRSYLGRGRFQELLRDFPPPDAQTPPAVAGQIFAGRAIAELGLERRDRAADAAQQAVRLAPQLAEPHLAAARVAQAANDRAAAEAAVDRALAIDANNVEGLLRKATAQFERGEFQPSVDTFGRLLAVMPGNVVARTRRAEAHLRLGNDAAARADVDGALRAASNYAPALYLRALLLVRANDWRGADQALTQMGPSLPNFADGLLMLATVKQQLNQTAQALDAAQRHVARRPDDPRGARLLAGMHLAANQPNEAAGVLERVVSRGTPDVETLELLARAHAAAGRARDAAGALDRAVTLAPDNLVLLARLAIARLASGDPDGAQQAANAVLARDPAQMGMHQILAAAALGRGDLAAATAALERVPAASRDSELSGVVDGTIRLVRVDLAGARQVFEGLLRTHPDSIRARLGLARTAAMQGNAEETERLLGEVLTREPGNSEALTRLVAAARSGTARAPAARAVLERVQAANPAEPTLALATASVLIAANEAARAAAILDAEPLRPRRRGTGALLLLAEAHAAQEKWADAEAAARAALAEEPENVVARQILASLLVRRGDVRNAETLVQVGLNAQPASLPLQTALVRIAQQERGLDAALEVADRLARQTGTRPASLLLRGDLLLSANRHADAAAAYAQAAAIQPLRELALRQSTAWLAAGRPEAAAEALSAWLARNPDDTAVASQLAQVEVALGRAEAAERRLTAIIAAAPEDAVSLNNLAWLQQARSDPATEAGRATLREARLKAERAYYLAPSPETSDTLGWILVRVGEAEAGLPLVRQAAAATVALQRANASMFYRLAYTLHAVGRRDEAIRVLEPTLAPEVRFPERAEATQLMERLRAGG
jgi:putative PEP-CTERM system TPR-repeat lipoprotein